MKSREFEVGDYLRTTKDAGRTDWSDGARTHVQWGAIGQVVRVGRGHGLCYEVRHKDKSAWYDHDELENVR